MPTENAKSFAANSLVTENSCSSLIVPNPFLYVTSTSSFLNETLISSSL